MSACLALEQPLRIAYLGPAGTFSHAAVLRHFGGFVEAVPHATIDEVFRALEGGQTDYAVVPYRRLGGSIGTVIADVLEEKENRLGDRFRIGSRFG